MSNQQLEKLGPGGDMNASNMEGILRAQKGEGKKKKEEAKRAGCQDG